MGRVAGGIRFRTSALPPGQAYAARAGPRDDEPQVERGERRRHLAQSRSVTLVERTSDLEEYQRNRCAGCVQALRILLVLRARVNRRFLERLELGPSEKFF